MPRPRATRKRDRVPTAAPSDKVNKRTVFTEEEDENEEDKDMIVDQVLEEKSSGRVSRRGNKDTSSCEDVKCVGTEDTGPDNVEKDDDSDAPEVVTSSSLTYQEEMLKLKQMHDMLSTKKKKNINKKRKLKQMNKIMDEIEEGQNVELDQDILEEVEQHEANCEEHDEGEHHTQVNQRIHFADSRDDIDDIRPSKQFGHVTVNVLSGDMSQGRRHAASATLASFGRSTSAIKFMESQSNTLPRTRFAVFASQKSIGPAKKICYT